MAISVRQLHPLFVGEIAGVDLREPLDDRTFSALEAAFDRHAVLVFPGQPIDAAQQVAFSERFGRLEAKTTRVMRKSDKLRLRSEFSDISNLDENNALMAADDRRLMFGLANQLWHTDSSFTRVPAKASLLSAHAIPPEGGDTEFADLRAAYDALAPALKEKLEGLVAEHSIFHSRAKIGYTDFSAEERAGLPAVPQVVVRTHPGSRRKTLYLASHASHIIGWPRAEGEKLIAELMEFATERRFVYRHRWRVGDLVMWDNRCTMHRGMPWDMQKYPRDLRRTTVEDSGPTVPQRVADQAMALG
jgi:alpha-ketoglutarate-dependent 2,4-dichlorophenoxyacetate dioxygenase